MNLIQKIKNLLERIAEVNEQEFKGQRLDYTTLNRICHSSQKNNKKEGSLRG
jgi:hypothetical protein